MALPHIKLKEEPITIRLNPIKTAPIDIGISFLLSVIANTDIINNEVEKNSFRKPNKILFGLFKSFG
jgi:hypothetical protein